ncbi:MAG: hypothetical protein FJZ08_01050 [Candidatus Omnitrophica bacterium]|nr:hypothetical protein [Candidatus Omnitrophota bacterium]
MPVLSSLCALLLLFTGCSSSTSPTYFTKDIAVAIQNICKNEYDVDVETKLVGQTLWIYLPVENMFTKSDKPEKYSEIFAVDYAQGEFKEGLFKMEYLVRPIPETMRQQGYKYDKAVSEKVNSVWKVLRRVIFSTDHSKDGAPKFFYMVTADIKNGFEIQELFYSLDLKKVSYGFISWSEYQHRSIQETKLSPFIIGDNKGLHLDYRDISMEEFLSRQISHRIKLKFQKAEVEKNADIDKEIYKIIAHTLKIYKFNGFTAVELSNLLTRDKAILNKADVLAGITN